MDVATVTNVVAYVVLLVLAGFVAHRGVRAYRRARRLLQLARHSVSSAQRAMGSAQWWAIQPLRRQMWRGVSGAVNAVEVARRRGVPIGDLQSLTRRLQATAADVDAALRTAAAAGRVPAELRRQAQQVTAAAADVTDTVTTAMAADNAPQVASLLDAVRVEVRALGH